MILVLVVWLDVLLFVVVLIFELLFELSILEFFGEGNLCLLWYLCGLLIDI